MFYYINFLTNSYLILFHINLFFVLFKRKLNQCINKILRINWANEVFLKVVVLLDTLIFYCWMERFFFSIDLYRVDIKWWDHSAAIFFDDVLQNTIFLLVSNVKHHWNLSNNFNLLGQAVLMLDVLSLIYFMFWRGIVIHLIGVLIIL